MNILVTGGAGFIGSAIAKRLVERSDRVVILDNFNDYYDPQLKRDRIEVFLKGIDFKLYEGDIRDAKAVKSLFADYQPDAILNFAAESHVDRSIEDPLVFVETNVVGTANLLHHSLTYWQNLSGEKESSFRYLQVSTDEVYGSLGETGKFSENTAVDPSSPYSASKTGADHLVRAWGRSFGVRATISNCSNNYGPYQHVEKFIPRQITEILEGRRPKLYGAGHNVRDWVHVDDHNDAVLAILEKGSLGETYLIGANGEKDNKTVIRKILELMGRDPDDFDHVDDRPGHDLRYAIDNSKLVKELNWQPKYTNFDKGIKQTIDWYCINEGWWKSQKLNTELKYKEIGR
jgi:dTDP-glucose 4,6-dehydratase